MCFSHAGLRRANSITHGKLRRLREADALAGVFSTVNLEYFKKNVGWRVQLVPTEIRLDEYDRELPVMNDDWLLESVTEEGVRISNVRTGHGIVLGTDHIHHFTSNPNRSLGVVKYGFLTLHVQVFLRATECWVQPNLRPGERVRVEPVPINEMWVDFRFVVDSGLQRKLDSEGYRMAWSLDTLLPRRLQFEGWEVVIEPDSHGTPTKFRMRDRPADQTLIKKLKN